MTTVALSLGSNVSPVHYLHAALDALHARFGMLRLSSVFESEAIGFTGDNFFNLAVLMETSESLEDLISFLKRLEDQHGRSRKEPRFSGRTLDIDVLTYGNCRGTIAGIRLPREEIVENAYVLWPLTQIAGGLVDPESGKTYSQLWQEYDRSRQRLWPVDFFWQGKQISTATGND